MRVANGAGSRKRGILEETQQTKDRNSGTDHDS